MNDEQWEFKLATISIGTIESYNYPKKKMKDDILWADGFLALQPQKK